MIFITESAEKSPLPVRHGEGVPLAISLRASSLSGMRATLLAAFGMAIAVIANSTAPLAAETVPQRSARLLQKTIDLDHRVTEAVEDKSSAALSEVLKDLDTHAGIVNVDLRNGAVASQCDVAMDHLRNIVRYAIALSGPQGPRRSKMETESLQLRDRYERAFDDCAALAGRLSIRVSLQAKHLRGL